MTETRQIVRKIPFSELEVLNFDPDCVGSGNSGKSNMYEVHDLHLLPFKEKNPDISLEYTKGGGINIITLSGAASYRTKEKYKTVIKYRKINETEWNIWREKSKSFNHCCDSKTLSYITPTSTGYLVNTKLLFKFLVSLKKLDSMPLETPIWQFSQTCECTASRKGDLDCAHQARIKRKIYRMQGSKNKPKSSIYKKISVKEPSKIINNVQTSFPPLDVLTIKNELLHLMVKGQGGYNWIVFVHLNNDVVKSVDLELDFKKTFGNVKDEIQWEYDCTCVRMYFKPPLYDYNDKDLLRKNDKVSNVASRRKLQRHSLHLDCIGGESKPEIPVFEIPEKKQLTRASSVNEKKETNQQQIIHIRTNTDLNQQQIIETNNNSKKSEIIIPNLTVVNNDMNTKITLEDVVNVISPLYRDAVETNTVGELKFKMSKVSDVVGDPDDNEESFLDILDRFANEMKDSLNNSYSRRKMFSTFFVKSNLNVKETKVLKNKLRTKKWGSEYDDSLNISKLKGGNGAKLSFDDCFHEEEYLIRQESEGEQYTESVSSTFNEIEKRLILRRKRGLTYWKLFLIEKKHVNLKDISVLPPAEWIKEFMFFMREGKKGERKPLRHETLNGYVYDLFGEMQRVTGFTHKSIPLSPYYKMKKQTRKVLIDTTGNDPPISRGSTLSITLRALLKEKDKLRERAFVSIAITSNRENRLFYMKGYDFQVKWKGDLLNIEISNIDRDKKMDTNRTITVGGFTNKFQEISPAHILLLYLCSIGVIIQSYARLIKTKEQIVHSTTSEIFVFCKNPVVLKVKNYSRRHYNYCYQQMLRNLHQNLKGTLYELRYMGVKYNTETKTYSFDVFSNSIAQNDPKSQKSYRKGMGSFGVNTISMYLHEKKEETKPIDLQSCNVNEDVLMKLESNEIIVFQNDLLVMNKLKLIKDMRNGEFESLVKVVKIIKEEKKIEKTIILPERVIIPRFGIEMYDKKSFLTDHLAFILENVHLERNRNDMIDIFFKNLLTEKEDELNEFYENDDDLKSWKKFKKKNKGKSGRIQVLIEKKERKLRVCAKKKFFFENFKSNKENIDLKSSEFFKKQVERKKILELMKLKQQKLIYLCGENSDERLYANIENCDFATTPGNIGSLSVYTGLELLFVGKSRTRTLKITRINEAGKIYGRKDNENVEIAVNKPFHPEYSATLSLIRSKSTRSYNKELEKKIISVFSNETKKEDIKNVGGKKELSNAKDIKKTNNKPKIWTTEEEEKLKERLKNNRSVSDIANEFGVSNGQISTKKYQIKQKKKLKKKPKKKESSKGRKRWNIDDDIVVDKLKGEGYTHEQISKRLGVGNSALENRLQRRRKSGDLKKSKTRKDWEDKEVKMLTKLKNEKKTYSDISKLMGRTISSVRGKWGNMNTKEKMKKAREKVEKITSERSKEKKEKREKVEKITPERPNKLGVGKGGLEKSGELINKRKYWKNEEVERLIKLKNENNTYKEISKLMPGRTKTALKSKWRTINKKKKQENKRKKVEKETKEQQKENEESAETRKLVEKIETNNRKRKSFSDRNHTKEVKKKVKKKRKVDKKKKKKRLRDKENELEDKPKKKRKKEE